MKKQNATEKIRIYPKTHKRLKLLALKADMTIGEYIEHLLTNKKKLNLKQIRLRNEKVIKETNVSIDTFNTIYSIGFSDCEQTQYSRPRSHEQR